ncbi:MAG TPA: DNA repair protein RecO [Clostridia bacterium]|nr:DNA repair protein RecO [Clostridia bacterium]
MLTVKGIITRVVDYKEKDRLLTIASFDKGLICVNARGVRGANAKLKGYASILTFGYFHLTETKSGYILSGVDCEENFFNLWTDTVKYSAGVLCLELFEKIAKEQDDNNQEIILLLKAMNSINYSEQYPLLYALLFMANMMVNLGVDYEEINDYDKDVYALITKLLASENDISKVGYTEQKVKKGIQFLNMLLKNSFNIKLKVISELFKNNII